MIKNALVLVVVALAGCANLAADSAGQIGCPPSEMTITDQTMGFNTNTWSAHCRGETFICSRSSGGTAQCSKALPKK